MDIRAIKAWVAYNYKCEAKNIELQNLIENLTGSPIAYYFYHSRGIIVLDEAYLFSGFAPEFKPSGHNTARYFAFEDGFNGKEPPSRCHPVLRHLYKKGVEAKVQQIIAA